MSDTPVLIRFNIQNAKFAVKNGDQYDAPVSFGTSRKLTLERDADEKNIYGDGAIIKVIPYGRAKKGALTLNNISDAYEIAMGRRLALSVGNAKIRQNAAVEHALYFETCGAAADGSQPVAKTWLFGVRSAEPNESYDQNTDTVNESSFDIPLIIKGIPLFDNIETSDVIYSVTLTPDDEGYAEFGDAVPTVVLDSNNHYIIVVSAAVTI